MIKTTNIAYQGKFITSAREGEIEQAHTCKGHGGQMKNYARSSPPQRNYLAGYLSIQDRQVGFATP